MGKSSCSDGGTTCSPPGYPAQYRAAECIEDAIFVAVLSKVSGHVDVLVNGVSVGSASIQKGAGLVQVPFQGRSGQVVVRLYRDGAALLESKGESVLTACPDGMENFNAWVGSAKA